MGNGGFPGSVTVESRTLPEAGLPPAPVLGNVIPVNETDCRRAPIDALAEGTGGVQPWRRVFHVATGIGLAAAAHWSGADSFALRATLAGATAASFSLDALRFRFPEANAVFFRWFRRLASPREARGPASSSWFLAGALAVSLLAPAHFVPSLLVLALADPAASVVGRLWGRRALGNGSWEGSATFFVVGCGVLVPWAGVPGGLLAAAVAAAVEATPWKLDDNLTTPLAVAAALWAMTAFP